MIKRIGLLVNNKAANGKSLKISTTVCEILNSKAINFQLFENNWPNDLLNFTEVWVIGGDGTLNYFINKFKNCNIPITIIKGGTGNDFAWKLYGNCTVEEQISTILKSDKKAVDVGVCNNNYFLNGVGIGFDGEVLKSMKSIRWIGGHLGYLIVVIKKIFGFKEYKFNLKFDDKIIVGKFLLMSIFNSSRTGGGFYIAPKALINDGLLDVVLCKPLSLFKRLINLPKIEKGNHLELPFIHYYKTKKIIIECDDSVPAQIDGELISSSKFEINIIESQFCFLF